MGELGLPPARPELLDAELGERMSAAVGLRNRIAHQDGTLDLDLVHAAARERLPELEELAGALARACEF